MQTPHIQKISNQASGKSGVSGAVKWASASNITEGLANAMITVILASLLGPAEYGIVAIAILLVLILEIIPGFGLDTALIQHSNLEPENLNAAFWFNVIFGILFAGLTILLSGWWSAANNSTQLGPVTITLSALIPLHCLSIVQTALLKRDMQFKSLAILNISATIASGLIGIGSAFAGMGVWALVLQHLTRGVVSCMLLWMASAWRPSGWFTWGGLKPLLDFASKTFVGELGVYFQNNIDSLVMGVAFGPTTVGLYRFASRLVELILSFVPRAIQAVALPHFSALQGEQGKLRHAFLKGSHVSCLATLPLLALLAGVPEKFLGAIGEKWFPAALTLTLLTLVGLGKVIILLTGPLMQALSKPGINSFNTWAFVVANACGVLAVANFVSAVTPGEQAAGIALVRVGIFGFVFAPLLFWQTWRVAGLSFKSIFVNLRWTLTAGLSTVVVNAFLNQVGLFSMIPNAKFNLFFVASIGALVWFVSLHMLDREGFEITLAEIKSLWNGFVKTSRI